MKRVDAQEWALLKEHAAKHLTDPRWLGGAYCVTSRSVHGRVLLPGADHGEAVFLRSLPKRGNV